MTIRDIRFFGDPVLTTRADEVTVFDKNLENLVTDMLETMDAAGGVGLAANQVGVTKRVFVYDCSH
ncbi:peptide deformylase, partial [Salmonella enterica subsp. enterica serovar Typhimurium]|nr:peptide deformylase [Salmonella enterica subsp. enterica serovar Typhimurium]